MLIARRRARQTRASDRLPVGLPSPPPGLGLERPRQCRCLAKSDFDQPHRLALRYGQLRFRGIPAHPRGDASKVPGQRIAWFRVFLWDHVGNREIAHRFARAFGNQLQNISGRSRLAVLDEMDQGSGNIISSYIAEAQSSCLPGVAHSSWINENAGAPTSSLHDNTASYC